VDAPVRPHVVIGGMVEEVEDAGGGVSCGIQEEECKYLPMEAVSVLPTVSTELVRWIPVGVTSIDIDHPAILLDLLGWGGSRGADFCSNHREELRPCELAAI